MANRSDSKKKLNVFDILVLLLALCLVITFGYRIYAGMAVKSDTDEVKYVLYFECDEAYDSLLDYLAEDQAVYFESSGELLGYFYAGEYDENGAIYEISNDIQTSVENDDDTNESVQFSGGNNTIIIPIETYKTVCFGGQLRLNVEAVKVKSGNYYNIGEMNFAEGSVIDVYTDNAVFTLTVKRITAADTY